MTPDGPRVHDRPGPPARTISIAMATYNGAAYLAEQLASIAAQTRLPTELVISDDASSDDTIDICRSFAQEVPFAVTVLAHASNVGFGQNFERALAACSGDFVFLCDQDDVWYPRKLEVMVDALDASPSTVLAIHDVRYCDSSLAPIGQTKLERYRLITDPVKHYVTGMATVVRGSFLECALPNRAPTDVVPHDAWLHECARALGGKLVLNDVLADYRRHADNATAGRTLNVARPTTRRELLRDAFDVDASDSASRLEIAFAAVAEWARSATACLAERGIASQSHSTKIAAKYLRWSVAAARRRRLLRVPRWRRPLPILWFMIHGGYTVFSGARSAAKDLLRKG